VPYPDDVAGVEVLYGTKANTNIFPTGQRWDAASSQVISNHETAETVCVNSSFVVNITVINPGSTDAYYNQEVSLDDSADGASPVSTWTWVGATTNHEDYSNFTFSISSAGLIPGTYYLIHKVDTTNRLVESREDDNILIYTGKIIVSDCNNSLAAFAARSIFYL